MYPTAVVLATVLLVPVLARSRAPSVVAPQSDVLVVHGSLAHHRLSNDLFRINGFWMRVEPDTVFHRWLLRGTGHPASIVLTTAPDRFADRANVRILTGRLVHQTAPSETAVVHIFFQQDALTGSLGAVTFQTEDRALALTVDAWCDAEVSLIVEIGLQ